MHTWVPTYSVEMRLILVFVSRPIISTSVLMGEWDDVKHRFK